ncbi:MAG: type II toxin-antitoxin system HicB family antitoxin [Smithella sp.]|jgi:predicted RNase H-like HicB family nuclease|nr:type II toxin-antitoxin system HicB family antitoxin [Smithella sp.]
MKKFLVVFEKTKTGFSAYAPDLPGCIATGRTKNETERNIFDAIQLHLEGIKEENIRLPKVQAESEVLVFN